MEVVEEEKVNGETDGEEEGVEEAWFNFTSVAVKLLPFTTT
jgi:hypothetical protein